MRLPGLAEIEGAARTVYRAFAATPQYRWDTLSARLGTHCWLKHENHTPVGAFKIRGGLSYFDHLAQRGAMPRAVMTATRGNHGQSVAWAARSHGVACTIVVPRGNSLEKNAAMRALGAELIEHGEDFQASREFAIALADERRAHMVPSFHAELLSGVATAWWELLRAVPELDVLYVPIGLGSGACAALAARAALGHRVRIVGVVSAGATTYADSLAAGRVLAAPVSTVLADGMACRVAEADALGAARAGPGPGGEGERRRSGRGHARPLRRHPQRGRRRGCRGFRRRLAGARALARPGGGHHAERRQRRQRAVCSRAQRPAGLTRRATISQNCSTASVLNTTSRTPALRASACSSSVM